jgi:DNA-binding response OmpR family regulator
MTEQPERLLVIDDEPLITQMLHRMLRRRFAVTTATDGATALAHVENGASFSLVICDLMMTPLSGVDVYERLRTLSPATAARLVFMTGGAAVKHVQEFLDRWPHPVLFKPFAVADVEHMVEATLARVAAAAKPIVKAG